MLEDWSLADDAIGEASSIPSVLESQESDRCVDCGGGVGWR